MLSKFVKGVNYFFHSPMPAGEFKHVPVKTVQNQLKEKQGEFILREGIKDQQPLLEKILTAEQLKNLHIGLAEGLFPIEIVKEFLREDRQWSGNQFIAMISDQGLNLLRQRELTWKDFSNQYISEEIASPHVVLEQLVQLKNLEMDFFKGASYDFTDNFSPLSDKEKKPNNILEDKKAEKLSAPRFSKSDALNLLPTAEAETARILMQEVQRYRKKGSSELDNNHRGPREFENLKSCLLQNQNNIEFFGFEIIKQWEKLGIVKHEDRLKLQQGAFIHYRIEATKSTFLANCDEMTALLLDGLDRIGYKKPAYIAHIKGGKHAFALVEGEDGRWQIWDPWSDKAYPYSRENLLKYMQNLIPGSSPTDTASHQLEDFDPVRHKIEYFKERSLESLREFRKTMLLAQQQSMTATEDEVTCPSPSS